MDDRLARAALGYGGRFVWSRAGGDPHIVALLEEALAALGEQESIHRVRLLARLSGALRDPPFRDRAAALSDDAVKMARLVGDPATLAYALDARHVVIWGPDSAEERAAITEEICRLADEADDRERAFEGRFWRLQSLIETGDLAAARTELEAVNTLAEELRQPAQRWYVAVTRAMLVLLEGRFDEAERLIDRALTLGKQAQSWEAIVYFRLQMFSLRSAQGRLPELEETIRKSVDEYPGYLVFRCVLANLMGQLRKTDECRVLFDSLATGSFEQLPRDEEWLFGVALLADVSSILGDASRAATLYGALRPYADRNVLSVPDVSMGSVSRSLGVLATTVGSWDEAVGHFEQALTMNERMGAHPWVARTQEDHAVMLLNRGGKGDRDAARELLGLAAENYRRLGMESSAERAAVRR
jgi:tetratricopeptide (TPR) repeat protein